MGIKDEPTKINGEKNPLFGETHLIKGSEMPVEHDFAHKHFWVVEGPFGEFTSVKCDCGKGKILDKNLKIVNGEIVEE